MILPTLPAQAPPAPASRPSAIPSFPGQTDRRERHFTFPGRPGSHRAWDDLVRFADAGGVFHADLFGPADGIKAMREALRGAGIRAPETSLVLPSGVSGGMQLACVDGLESSPVFHRERLVGRVFEDARARWCLLGGLLPEDLSASAEAQTEDVFRAMADLLGGCGMDFKDVARTWFYNDRILDWYAGFNRARTTFFRDQGLGMMPASTGIGAPNPWGAALVAKLVAVRPKNGTVAMRPVESPLQCSAFDYGSAFSRAVEVGDPDGRVLYVSGTASIEPGGKTIHQGDAKRQIDTTMEVVEALLANAGMSLGDTTRGVAYFRHAEDVPLWDAWCRAHSPRRLPVLPVESTVCRDDLLFELELDAASGIACMGKMA